MRQTGREWKTRLLRASCLLGLLLGVLGEPARAESGEYRTTITLLPHGPQGSNPVTLDTAAGSAAGTANLGIDLAGRVSGTLTIGGSSVSLSGKLRLNASAASLTLRAKPLGVVFRGTRSNADGSYSGQLRDRRGVIGGTGRLRLDVSNAQALAVDLYLALPNGTRVKRKGYGTATAQGSTFPLVASTTVGAGSSRLRASGGGFSFVGFGSVGTGFQLSSFRCTAFGVTVGGSGGSLSHSPNPPSVTLILVSGHPFGFASDARPYLAEAGGFGPALVQSLNSAGYDVETHAFVDHYYGTVAGDGYVDLLATLQAVNDAYVTERTFPTKVLVVDHSHGGVRAHQALQSVPELPVRLLVDLDASSCDFNIGHLLEPSPDPVDAWFIGERFYDEEDVIPASVALALEVSSNELCGFSIFGELYDDSYNVRETGGVGGLFYFDAQSDHAEVHEPYGTTFWVVRRWILDNL